MAAPLSYQITPQRRALLNTIRYAEGTWANGSNDGYRIKFGGSKFDDMSRHPDDVIHAGGYASAAAGAYQFMPFTWKGVSKAIGAKDFGIEAQDQGALHLIERRGMLGRFDKEGFNPQVVAGLAGEWASFPTLAGKSAYGQPNKRYSDLERFYNQQLELLNKGGGAANNIVPVRPDGPTAPAVSSGSSIPSDEKQRIEAFAQSMARGDENPFDALLGGGASALRMAGSRLGMALPPIAPAMA